MSHKHPSMSRTIGSQTELRRQENPRRGVITVFAAFLMVMMLAMVAFAVDVGYMMTAQAQLQIAADSAAMAAAANMSAGSSAMLSAAQTYSANNKAVGKAVNLASSDVEYGTWDSSARAFTSTGSVSNAVRVTARRDNSTGANGTFFGRVLGLTSFNIPVKAVAIANPRDICFVVDLSGSMNRDTWTGYGSSASYRSSGYTSAYSTMMTQIFSDFSFGTYPGSWQKIGSLVDASATWSGSGSHGMYSTNGPLSSAAIPATYRILGSDSSSTRQGKAYKWVIDNQLATLLGNAKPSPSSGNANAYNYYRAYIDSVVSNSGVLGPRSYVSWVLDSGRDQIADSSYGSDYAQISTNSPNTPYHSETVGSQSFQFPPREYPTHAERRSVIAGLQQVVTKNSTISDTNQKDWVSIVTFDKTGGVKTRVALTSDYTSAMNSAAGMQAVGNNGNSTNTEEGLASAYALIKAQSQGGTGRENTQKIVILLTDGVANLKDSSNSTVSSYEAAHPNTFNGVSNYYGSSDYNSDAAFMQASIMQGGNWHVYALGIGLAVDTDFMDKMARVGNTADSNGHAPVTSGDPTSYETEMTALLDQIINNPQVHLVQ
jgi:Flp pilus assembly protein TadG